MKRNLILIIVGMFAVFPILACQALTGTQFAPSPTIADAPQVVNVQSGSAPDLVLQQDTLISLYKRVGLGVVSIKVISDSGGGQASGFVYDKDGHIITNYHVIEDAKDIEVDFPSGVKVRGKVLGTDLDSDIAVLKVDVPANQLTPIPLGNIQQVQVGQTVIAIGNPFGYSGTMTTGIVSALGRTSPSKHATPTGSFYTAGDIIQTDTAINPGNSGGPLLNMNGEVIGINWAIETESSTTIGQPVNSGIGFAIPVGIVKRVLPTLIAGRKYDYPYLGLTSLPDLSLLDQENLKLPQATGAYITSVVPGGPAEKAGLRGGSKQTDDLSLSAGGDLIIAIDGQKVLTFGDMLSYLINTKGPGDTVTLTILRDNKEMEVKLVLEKRP